MDEVSATDTAKRRGTPRWAVFLVVLSLIAVALVLLGRVYYSEQVRVAEAQKAGELQSIAALKVSQIVEWRGRLLTAGRLIQESGQARADLARWARDPRASHEASSLVVWMGATARILGYDDAVLVSAAGERLGTARAHIDTSTVEVLSRVLASAEPTLTDLHASSQGRPQLELLVPLPTVGNDASRVAMVLTGDPRRFLFPLIQSWPVPSASAETLLVRREGDHVLYLNDLRFREGAALRFAQPLSRTDLPAVMAVTGTTGSVSGTDYRGELVLGAVEPIPGSTWYLVAKVDEREAHAGIFQIGLVTAGGVALLILIAALVVGLLWRQDNLNRLRERMELEQRECAERERVAAVLAERDETIRAFFESADIFMSVIEITDDDVVYASPNEKQSSYFGRSIEEMTGQTGRTLGFPDDVRAFWHEQFAITQRTGTTHSLEFPFEWGGRTGWYQGYITPLAGLGGQRQKFTWTAIETTARKVAEDELRTHRDELETLVLRRTRELAYANETLAATNRDLSATNEELVGLNEELARATAAKSDFLANMSHELRTPLNSIIGFTGLLTRGMTGELTDEQHRQVAIVNNAGRHLLTLVNDVLDLAKIEAGRVEIHEHEVDLGIPVGEAVTIVGPLAQQAGLALEVSGMDALGPVVTDQEKVRQILLNLLSNAVKFTHEGGIMIHGETVAGGRIAISVADTGTGIPERHLETVFEEFAQLPATDGRAKPAGTGLGLAISRRFARLLGGDLTVTSTMGAGSVFTLELPREGIGASAGADE